MYVPNMMEEDKSRRLEANWGKRASGPEARRVPKKVAPGSPGF